MTGVSARGRDIETPVGLARALVWRPPNARGTIALGHGAGGSSWSGDLTLLTELAGDGWAVVLVEQPWRVAGGRSASRPPVLDQAWLTVLGGLLSGRGKLPRPLVAGGRSAGARVACRTATQLGAAAVLALAFPLRYPGGRGDSRAGEARAVTDAGIPLCVIQGSRDPFGTPAEVRAELGTGPEVYAVPGTHSFGAVPHAVLDRARSWLDATLPLGSGG